MVCCCIKEKSPDRIKALLEKVEMAEIRLDLCELTVEQTEDIFSCGDIPLIATCRAENLPDGGFFKAEQLLTAAIRAGAHFADLEIEAPKSVSKRIAASCAQWGTTLIRSYHNYSSTPDAEQLKAIVDKCRHHDGEIVKIVTAAGSQQDIQTVKGLYRYYTPESLIAFPITFTEDARLIANCTESRLSALSMGCPIAYCAWDESSLTAPGQMTYPQMYNAVYGNRKSVNAATVQCPSSKSYAQRAILFAALSDGTSTVRGYTECGDSESAVSLAEQLGASVSRKQEEDGMECLEIKGIGRHQAQNPSVVNVGESGLLARMMIPLAAQLYDSPVIIQGTGTLTGRPMEGAGASLRKMGGNLEQCFRDENGVVRPCADEDTDDACSVPFRVSGPLKGGYCQLDGRYSSQVISGALAALPLCGRSSTLKVTSPTSIPYIYLTMDLLRKAGIKVRGQMFRGRQELAGDWSNCTEMVLKIKEKQVYRSFDLTLEGDWSAASVFMCLGAIFGQVSINGLDTSSLQADLEILDILMDAGAVISQDGEPCGTVSVHKAPLRRFYANLSNCPDLFPVASVLCAFCQGRNVLRGMHRLSHKESDRGTAILEMLLNMGVRASTTGDDLVIDGESLPSRIMNGRLLKGGRYSSHHDHRMVMALRLAEVGADCPIEIDDEACVDKSFPAFNNVWKKCTSYE